MVRWIIGVTLGILVVAAIGTGVVLMAIPNNVTVTVHEQTAAPVPFDLSAQPVTDPPEILLTWTDEILPEVTAVVQRTITPDDESTWQDMVTLETGATSYRDQAVKSGTTYFYRIRTSTLEGDSGFSPIASAEAGP